MPIFIPLLLAGGAIAAWLGSETGQKLAGNPASGTTDAIVPPQLPAHPPGVPASPGGAVTAPAAAASSSNGWGRAAFGLGVFLIGWKVLSALYKASHPTAPRVVVINNRTPRRKPRVVRVPGTRGRQRGVWTKRGTGPYTFQPFTGRP